MNNLTRILYSLGAFAAAGLIAQAQTAPKILIVDMAKIFDNYYKTKAEKVKLDDASKKARDEIYELNKEGNALVAEYNDFEKEANSPTATLETKDKALRNAQKKSEEIQAKKQDINDVSNNANQSIQQRIQSFRIMMLGEISKVAATVAKSHGATLLVDKSGASLLGVSPLIYFDPADDITSEVMAEIDRNRPASVPASAAPTPNAGSTAPSEFSIPNVSPPAK